MSKIYFTITGINHYLGTDFLKKDMKVRLKKEPDNESDAEAIMLSIKRVGENGYVANSPYTVIGDSLGAGRLCD